MRTPLNQIVGGLLERSGLHPRFPLVFRLRPTDASFAERAPFVFDNRAFSAAAPEVVFDELVNVAHGRAWLPQFLCIEQQNPDAPIERRVNVETFTFMSLRVRTLDAARGERWVAAVEACSLPIAQEMLQVATFAKAPDGGTDFRWRIYYNTSELMRPLRPLGALPFEHFFRTSAEQLAAWCAA